MTPSSHQPHPWLNHIQKHRGPFLVVTAIFIGSALLLRAQGRLWICACGTVRLWAGDIWSADNSQHLFDPYTFTHILHGFIFYGAFVLLLPRLPLAWRLCLALTVEAAWEVFENSATIIDRYRTVTLALGYTGDTIINSMTDILACAFGFWLARRLGPKKTILLFFATELFLLAWIRDGLLLNILMLLYPVPAIQAWQTGR